MVAHETWEGFAGAVVHLSLPAGDHRLEPRRSGTRGAFPFSAPVHIITAYNPAGEMVDEAANETNHTELAAALREAETLATIGSAPDGSMAEPGFAVLGLELDDAVELGRRFGQAAIYRWTEDTLAIIGVSEPRVVRMGWSLVRLVAT
jgi:hypothetical protein